MLDPAFRPVSAVVAGLEAVLGAADVVVEDAAVIDDAGHHLDAVFLTGRQGQSDGPGLQRIENEHRPVDEVAEFFEAVNEVERETVGRAGGDAEAVGEACGFRAFERLPERLAGVAELVGIVEHEQVELVGAAAFELFGGRPC